MSALPTYRGEDCTGKVYGLYTVISLHGYVEYGSGKRQIWLVRCDCGTVEQRQIYHVVNAKLGCSSCKGLHQRGQKSPHWRGGSHVPAYFVAKAKRWLVRRSKTLDWNLTLEDLDELWLTQEGKCVYTGWQLTFGDNATEQTASLDRINSDLGYVPGNVQFVHKDINTMKWSLPEDRFLSLCRAVVKNVD